LIKKKKNFYYYVKSKTLFFFKKKEIKNSILITYIAIMIYQNSAKYLAYKTE